MMFLNKENEMVDDYVVFDLETTGLEASTCEIIEIGALKYKNNELVDEFSVLIKPKNSIPEIITKITGIDDNLVKNEESIESIMPKFLDFIGDYALVAHNSNFDLGFIEETLKKLNMSIPYNKNIDTLELAKIYIPKAYNHKLETLKKFFRLDYGSHRSIDDCKTTNYVYQYCKRAALVQN